MKKILTYFAIGCFLAIVGALFSDICGSIFNGMDYGTACAIGIGMFLCVVVVTCTGIIVSKIESKKKDDASEEKQD